VLDLQYGKPVEKPQTMRFMSQGNGKWKGSCEEVVPVKVRRPAEPGYHGGQRLARIERRKTR
jgi:hypothetical protein